jgi:hypothetical protein
MVPTAVILFLDQKPCIAVFGSPPLLVCIAPAGVRCGSELYARAGVVLLRYNTCRKTTTGVCAKLHRIHRQKQVF